MSVVKCLKKSILGKQTFVDKTSASNWSKNMRILKPPKTRAPIVSLQGIYEQLFYSGKFLALLFLKVFLKIRAAMKFQKTSYFIPQNFFQENCS